MIGCKEGSFLFDLNLNNEVEALYLGIKIDS